MTVPNVLTKVSHTGDGVTYNWPITFKVDGITSDEVEVWLVTIATGVSVLLTSNYSVDLAVPEVVYPVSGTPPSNAYQVLLVRKLSLTQDTDYKNQGPLPAETIEEGSDRHTMVEQQLQEQIDRTIKADISQEEATLDEITQAAQANEDAAEAAAVAAAASSLTAEEAEAAALAAQVAAEIAQEAAELAAGFEVASQAEAEAAENNTKVMTPLRVKQEVEFAGAVSIPAANLPAQDAFTTGMIMMWSGSIATIPSGWLLCDGTLSTPDLRNRMIMGAQEDVVGVAHTNVSGALTQTGGEASHLLTADESGLKAHTHVSRFYYHSFTSGSSTNSLRNDNLGLGALDKTGGEATEENADSPHNVLNPYYALAFIMKS